MAVESWRMSRAELRDLLNKYERAVEEDAAYLLNPSARELQMLGQELITTRRDRLRLARDTNRRFVESAIDDLPDLCAGPPSAPSRPVMEVKVLDENAPTLPASSYGSMASVFLHLFRDWSSHCEHVDRTTYQAAVDELTKRVKPGAQVLVPGAGLARLAAKIAKEGYVVESNEASRLFLTFADFTLNRARGADVYPLAHVFSENFGYQQQYVQTNIPSPTPASFATSKEGSGKALFSMVPGDFSKLYCKGGKAHRKFDAIVTCFFLDTVVDVCELVQVLDDLLEEGGLWINVGPLNWRKEARLKLNWSEIVTLWKGLGYDFEVNSRSDCDYHMPRGEKMYTESYTCALSVATKKLKSKA